jgi:hypothetical protein
LSVFPWTAFFHARAHEARRDMLDRAVDGRHHRCRLRADALEDLIARRTAGDIRRAATDDPGITGQGLPRLARP